LLQTDHLAEIYALDLGSKYSIITSDLLD